MLLRQIECLKRNFANSNFLIAVSAVFFMADCKNYNGDIQKQRYTIRNDNDPILF